jgi:predicted Ser/Thr protein kinase
MAASRSHFHIAISSGGLDTAEGRQFFQERLAIFAFWNSLLSFSFLPLRLGLEAAFSPDFEWTGVLGRPGIVAHVTSSLAMAVVWLVARRARVLGIRTLAALDVVATFTVGIAFAMMGASLAYRGGLLISDPMVAMLTATLGIAFTLIWRAVVVPSTPQRTAALTTLAIAPLIVADILVLGVARPSTAGHPAAAPFAVLWALVTLAIAVVASNVVFGLRREVQRARRLGQYTLDEKIGEGAMGIVYRAHHAMLRRPTAIKLLAPQRMGQRNVQRFEREVQLTAMLTHPNTVAIYDYGRTPDGVFYYAMEYLDGIDLEDLVRRHGAQPEGRVIHILRQVCRALAEAHGLGVIHRDIKPGNIILTIRGGEPDVAKVVDFGLVKELDTADGTETTSIDSPSPRLRRRLAGAPAEAEGNVLIGTPLYLSPEAITVPESVDARSDLYAVGAVGYFLLTGEPLFEGRTIMELCAHHLHTVPTPPSVRMGRPVDERLESALLTCLAKSPDDRPPSAQALHDVLAASRAASNWSAKDARRWWAGFRPAAPPPGERPSEVDTIAVDLAAR